MELLEFNQKGMIPGVNETEKEFFERARKVKNLSNEVPENEWLRLHLKELFDIGPVPAFYSNQNLAPWQGAASWVEGKRLVSVQLREGLRKGSYLGIVQREEILAHESVHAARAGLQSRKWEEFFAYMTSEKKWRRVLGPIVRSPWEVWPFLGAIGLGIFWEIGNVLAATWLIMGFGRLVRGHWILRKASEKMIEIVGNKRKARAVLVRLTDEEIEKLAKGKEIGGDCLRWKVIRLAYFK